MSAAYEYCFFFCQLHITWNLFRTKNLYVVLSKNCTLAATPSTTISYFCFTIRYYTRLYQNYNPTPPCVSLMAMVQLQSWRTLLKLSINLPAILTQFFFLLDKMPFGIQVERYMGSTLLKCTMSYYAGFSMCITVTQIACIVFSVWFLWHCFNLLHYGFYFYFVTSDMQRGRFEKC